MPDDNITPGKPTGTLGDLVKGNSILELALAVPMGCLVGWGIGTLLDRWVHTDWIVVVGIVLGAIGGFLRIFMFAKQYLKRGDQ